MKKLSAGEIRSLRGVKTCQADEIHDFRGAGPPDYPFDQIYSSPDAFGQWAEDQNGGGAYGTLNARLHGDLRSAIHYHYFTEPFDVEAWPPLDPLRDRVYQFWDWSDPTFEAVVCIAENELSGDLLKFFQTFLSTNFPSWCIDLRVASELCSTEDEVTVLIFGDRIVIPDVILPDSITRKLELSTPAEDPWIALVFCTTSYDGTGQVNSSSNWFR